MLAQQALYPLGHLPSPLSRFFKIFIPELLNNCSWDSKYLLHLEPGPAGQETCVASIIQLFPALPVSMQGVLNCGSRVIEFVWDLNNVTGFWAAL